jgi:hypothetical protein
MAVEPDQASASEEHWPGALGVIDIFEALRGGEISEEQARHRARDPLVSDHLTPDVVRELASQADRLADSGFVDDAAALKLGRRLGPRR